MQVNEIEQELDDLSVIDLQYIVCKCKQGIEKRNNAKERKTACPRYKKIRKSVEKHAASIKEHVDADEFNDLDLSKFNQQFLGNAFRPLFGSLIERHSVYMDGLLGLNGILNICKMTFIPGSTGFIKKDLSAIRKFMEMYDWRAQLHIDENNNLVVSA